MTISLHLTSIFNRFWRLAASVPLRVKIMGMAVGIALMIGIFSIALVHDSLSNNTSAQFPEQQRSLLRDHAARSGLIRRLTYSMFGFMAVAMAMAALLTWLIVRPVKALLAGTRAVRRGDYSVIITDMPGDEIGRLMQDFNEMTLQLRHAEQTRQEKEMMRQELLQRIISSQEGERKRIARELHDQTGQSLAALMVGLKLLENATTLEDAQKNIHVLKKNLTRELEIIHQMAVELRPNILDDAGIVVGLRQYVDDFQKKHAIECGLVILGFDRHRLPLHIEIAIYRVIQEALTNVMRHAQAENVQVILEWRQNGIRGVVSDDGAGFDVVTRRAGRLGIYGMEERITLLGGEFTIESEEGAGTMITFLLPGTPLHGNTDEV